MRIGNGTGLTPLRGRLTLPGRSQVLEAWGNGVALSSLDPRICLVDIAESEEIDLRAEIRGESEGKGLRHLGRKALTVTLSVHIKAWEPAVYGACMEKLRGWAKACLLAVSYRPDEVLSGFFHAYPQSSPQNWDRPVTLRFAAYKMPYWVRTQTEVLYGVASGLVQLYLTPTGDGPYCFMEGEIQNQGSGNLSEITVYCPETGTAFMFNGLELPKGDGMRIFYENGYLRLRRMSDGFSLFPRRLATSSDDLLLVPGRENAVQVWGNQICSFGLRTHGTCK